MTEWIVENISEAFAKKMFPAYKEIFDLFTRVFIQSKQVSVPMDILRMALYERVSGHMPASIKKEVPKAEILEKVETKIGVNFIFSYDKH
jgi:hypothetical protein